MTGAILPAADFERWGLVNEVLEPAELMPRALAIAEELANAPPDAVRGLKTLTRLATEADLEAGFAAEGDLVRKLFRSDIAKTRIREFAEKSAKRTSRSSSA